MRTFVAPLFAVAFFSVCPDAAADEGRLEINQAKADAGGVTPGDAAGCPVEINAAGHYVLTGPLSCPVPSDPVTYGVLIQAANVTLDLNGFGVEITPGAGNLGDVVRVEPSAANATIRNGYVRASPGTGALAGVQVFADDATLEHLTLSGSFVSNAIVIGGVTGGARFQVLDSRVSGSGSNGILINTGGSDGLVARNHVFGNGGFGIRSNPPGAASLIRLEGNVFAANALGTFLGANLFASGPNYCNGTAVCP